MPTDRARDLVDFLLSLNTTYDYPEALPVTHKIIVGPEVAPAGIGWNFREWYVPKEQQRYRMQP